MKNRKQLKRYIYRTPLPGGNIILLGAALMLVWAVWEFAIRYDGAVATWKGQYQLVEDGYITYDVMIKNILKVPETKNALMVTVVLALIAVFSIITLLCHARWVPAFFIIPVSALIIFYHTSNSWFFRVLNLFETVKLYAALGVIAGETLNAAVALKRRYTYVRRLRERERARLEARRRRRPTTHGTGVTLIPERIPERTCEKRKPTRSAGA